MFEEKDLTLIFRRVKSYTEETLGLVNSFTPHLDIEGNLFPSESERGSIDFKNSRILLNYKGLLPYQSEDLFPEFAASVLAYYQAPAYLYEAAKKKQLSVTPEYIIEVAQSRLFQGICKKVEYDTGIFLQNSYGFRFSEIEADVMREIMDDDEIDSLPDSELEGFSKLERKSFNRGFRLTEEIQEKVRGYKRENDVLRRSLIVCVESENFDEEYRKLASYNRDDILIHLGLEVRREPSLDVTNIEKEMAEIERLMGRREQGRYIKERLDNLYNLLVRSGVRKSVLDRYKKMRENVGKMNDYGPPKEIDTDLINQILDLIRTEHISRVKESKPEIKEIEE